MRIFRLGEFLPIFRKRLYPSITRYLHHHIGGGFTQTTYTNDRDRYDDWLTRAGHPKDVHCTDLIAYWQA